MIRLGEHGASVQPWSLSSPGRPASRGGGSCWGRFGIRGRPFSLPGSRAGDLRLESFRQIPRRRGPVENLGKTQRVDLRPGLQARWSGGVRRSLRSCSGRQWDVPTTDQGQRSGSVPVKGLPYRDSDVKRLQGASDLLLVRSGADWTSRFHQVLLGVWLLP